MSEGISVDPTPIQRNQRDVAMELTQLYFKEQLSSAHTIENIRTVYSKFYATVRQLEDSNDRFQSSEVKRIISEFNKK